MIDLKNLKRVTQELNNLYLCLDVLYINESMTDRNPKKRYKGGWEQYPPDFNYPTREERPEHSDSRVNIRKSNRKKSSE